MLTEKSISSNLAYTMSLAQGHLIGKMWHIVPFGLCADFHGVVVKYTTAICFHTED